MPYCSDIAEAELLAKRLFPELADVTFEIPKQGHQHFVLIHGDQVIRIARHEWSAKCITREREILRLIEASSPVSVPQVIGVDTEHNLMRTTRVKGRHLSPEEIDLLSEKELKEISIQVAEFMSFIHQLSLSEEQKTAFSGDPAYFHQRTHTKIEALLRSDLKEKDRKLLEKSKLYIENHDRIQDDIVLVHGDLIFGNILYDDKTGKIGIVDFTGTSMGYRHTDFKKMLSYKNGFLNHVLDAYKEMTGYEVDTDLIKIAYSLNSSYNWKPDQDPEFVY